MEKDKVRLTRKTKELIKEAIQSLPEEDKNNRNAICQKIAFDLYDKHQGRSLEYQSERMGMDTTGKILEKVEYFFIQSSKRKAK